MTKARSTAWQLLTKYRSAKICTEHTALLQRYYEMHAQRNVRIPNTAPLRHDWWENCKSDYESEHLCCSKCKQ